MEIVAQQLEHWQLKPEVLGSISGGATFLRAVFKVFGHNNPDCGNWAQYYWSLDLGVPFRWAPQCCDYTHDSTLITHTLDKAIVPILSTETALCSFYCF